MKVMVVDDIENNRKLLRIMLQEEGYETMEAADGAEALALMEREMPDAIVSDILMPNMDGYRFCRAVRQDARFRRLPFIFYTSTYISDGDQKLAMDCGANLYLQKPAPAKVVLQSLRDLANLSPQESLRYCAATDEAEVMKEYSQVLINKLEEKNADLRVATDELARINQDLEQRVQERTAELVTANQELEAFSHSLAHDLRSPLMVIEGFCEILVEDCRGKVDETAMKQLGYLGEAARRMTELTNDLLRLARASRAEMKRTWVKLGPMAEAAFHDVRLTQPDRQVRFSVAPDLVVNADRSLLRITLENLLNNAWKYTGKTEQAEIEVGLTQRGPLPHGPGGVGRLVRLHPRVNGVSYGEMLRWAHQVGARCRLSRPRTCAGSIRCDHKPRVGVGWVSKHASFMRVSEESLRNDAIERRFIANLRPGFTSVPETLRSGPRRPRLPAGHGVRRRPYWADLTRTGAG